MHYIKLQIGCFLVIAFLEISYIKATLKSKIPCNLLFDALMVFAPWAVFFDGLTAWTANHLDTVPAGLNLFFHLAFFVFMDLTVLVTAMYMYDHLVGFHRCSRKGVALFILPELVSLGLIVGSMGNLTYVEGVTTNYSMGIPVYVGYGTLIFYYGIILLLVFLRRRLLPREKLLEILSFILIPFLILAVQVTFPESLLTAIFPTMLMLGIYVDFENPSIRKLTQFNEDMVDGFATMVESRDNNTGSHIKRTRSYVNLILNKMRHSKQYQHVITRDYLSNVRDAAPLHDVGKIATPDSILQKPGKLTPEEYAIIQQHAPQGGEIIRSAFHSLDNEEFKQIAYEIARYHHEKYNGTGYPDGLAGEDIPLHARIMTIADVFDAVSQRRCYRDALSVEECFKIIEQGSGRDFDPGLVKLFLDAKQEVIALMNEEQHK